MRCLLPAFAVLACLTTFVAPALAKDDLLEALAQNGSITMEQYEKLKAQRKGDLVVNTEEGFRLATADGSFTMQVGTLLQLDVAMYQHDQVDLADGSELRRARLSLSGTFYKDWQYRFEHEFSGVTGVTDAYVAYTALKPLIVTVGQFKQPFSMDSLASDKSLSFMERGLPFAFFASRAPGLMLSRSGARWSAHGGLFGEPVGNAQSGDEGYGLTTRVSYVPLLDEHRVVHLGLAGMLRYPTADNSGNTTGTRVATARFRSKPESNVLAQRLVDTGEIREVDNYQLAGVELAARQGAWSLQAEGQYLQLSREAGRSLDFNGWYAQLAYVLTGELRPYRMDRGVFEGLRPTQNFGRDGWGAFELAGRVSGIDLGNQDIDGGLERNASLALNWTLNPLLRVSANVVRVLCVKGGPFDSQEPTIYQLRMQLAL